MKKTLKLTGLDCPVCAQNLEDLLKNTEGVLDAKVLYPIGMAKLDYVDDAALERAKRNIASFEEVRVVEEEGVQAKEKGYGMHWVRMAISALLLAGAICLSIFGDILLTDILSYVLYGLAYVTVAYPILIVTVKNLRRGNVFDENFLMTVASIGAFCIGEFWEGVLVILLYELGETLQSIAVGSSRKSVAQLMELKTEYATRMVVGGAETVTPEELVVGDKLLVKTGERLPCDCKLLSKSATLDVKSLTGESALLKRSSGEELLAGSINAGEAFMALVERAYEDSAVAKILNLVENSIEMKAPPEKFITKFSKVYTPFVCMLAVCIALFPPIITGLIEGTYAYVNGKQWIETALTFLVISCPCALVISVPLTYFAGIGKCAKQGILVKGAVNLDAVAKTKVAALDKTGTLTKGNFSVIGAYPEGITQDELLSICSALEAYSAHPIAGAFSNVLASERALHVQELIGKGLKGEYRGKRAIFGTAAFLSEEGFEVMERFSADTVLYLVHDEKYCGCLEIGVIREESKQLLA
jgi:Cd2+/Zn2+-exporting ATPase